MRLRVIVAAVLSAPLAAGAQGERTNWWVPTALGFAGAGAALGYSAVFVPQWMGIFTGETKRYEARTFQLWSWGTAASFGVVGALVGASTDRAIRRDERVSRWQRRSAQFGSVFTGASAGMYAAYRFTEARCETCWSRPARTAGLIAVGPGVGGLLGYAAYHRAQRTLNQPLRLSVLPSAAGATLVLRLQ